MTILMNIYYYESTKRKWKTKYICGCRCYERLQPNTKEFTTGEATGYGPGPRSRSTWWPQMRPPQTGVFWGVQQMRPPHNGVFLGGGWPDLFLETGFQLKKKIWRIIPFFFRLFWKTREKGMANAQPCPTTCEEVLDTSGPNKRWTCASWPQSHSSPPMCPDVRCAESDDCVLTSLPKCGGLSNEYSFECHSHWWHHTLSYNRDGHSKPIVWDTFWAESQRLSVFCRACLDSTSPWWRTVGTG